MFSPQLNRLDWQLCPAIIFTVADLGQFDPCISTLAEIVQNILLASYIHRPMPDEKDVSQKSRILLGDYLLGLGFFKLSVNELFRYMKEFTELITTINKGVVLRWRLKNTPISFRNWERIFGQEKASITALSGRIAASIAGLSADQIKLSQDIGCNLGMAWAVEEESLNWDLSQMYLKKAEDLIEKLNDNADTEKLSDLYTAFLNNISR